MTVPDPIAFPESHAAATKDGQRFTDDYYSIFQRLVEAHNALQVATGDTETGLGTKATKVGQTEAWHGLILVPANQTYTVVLKAESARTITEVTVKSTAGTCTFTVTVNGGSIGGTANSVSSVEESQTHSFAVAADDSIEVTVSGNSSCLNLSFSIKYTYDLI